MFGSFSRVSLEALESFTIFSRIFPNLCYNRSILLAVYEKNTNLIFELYSVLFVSDIYGVLAFFLIVYFHFLCSKASVPPPPPFYAGRRKFIVLTKATGFSLLLSLSKKISFSMCPH